jgi:hypothetical protein
MRVRKANHADEECIEGRSVITTEGLLLPWCIDQTRMSYTKFSPPPRRHPFVMKAAAQFKRVEEISIAEL